MIRPTISSTSDRATPLRPALATLAGLASLASLTSLTLLAPGCGGLKLQLVDASVRKPSNVAVYFTVDTSSGQAHSHTNRIYVIWDENNSERVAHSDDGTTWTTVVIGGMLSAAKGLSSQSHRRRAISSSEAVRASSVASRPR